MMVRLVGDWIVGNGIIIKNRMHVITDDGTLELITTQRDVPDCVVVASETRAGQPYAWIARFQRRILS